MLLLIDEAKNQREEIKQKIPEVKRKLSLVNVTQQQKEEAAITESKINDDIRELTKTITSTKMNKFQRDKKDYDEGAIYSWQRRHTRGPPRRGRTVSFSLPGSTTSEDEDRSDTSLAGSSHFLDKTRTPHSGAGRKHGGADGGGGKRQLRPRQPHQNYHHHHKRIVSTNKPRGLPWGLHTPPTMRDYFWGYGKREQLQEFHQYLNSTNPNIKLSLEFSNKEINFLDLLISLDEQGSIHTSLFRKSTDRNTVLHAESFHPKSLIENIPFGQFQRLKRICNSQTDFNTQATEMQQRFVQRGYKAKTLSGALTRAKTLDRRNLLIRRQRAPSQTKNRIFCTLQYSNMAYKIKNAITKNWSILACDPSLGPLFSEPPRFAFKKAPTLKDKIVKNYLPASKLETFFKKPIGTFRCGACVHCTQINRSTHFMDSTCTYTFKCRSFANCNTTHVVYRLDCVCGCFYIGRTKRKLKERFAEHKYAIRKGNMEYPIAKHFKNMTHTNINELTIMAIEVIENTPRGGDRLKRLLQRETFWIHSLKATVFPGLNEEIDFSPFL
ncbi:uncharacterized protein LOC111575603 isoform X1 [Amphiprion ocellaris]|nr:uncharacterized protein LOC129347251 isoform X2 [Amphiprion ocellaris]XP_054868216.1 uncharacterized protein LOC111575603 isoform X1 [Amphiprion ocellaris]